MTSNFDKKSHPAASFHEQVFDNLLGKVKTSRKRYDCKLCLKGFSRPSALKTHVYTHTGEKPHQCNVTGCGRSFAVISNLRRHLRVHKPSHIKRRLTSQERRHYVERLINRSSGSVDEEHIGFLNFPSTHCSNDTTSSSATNDFITMPKSHGLTSPTLSTTSSSSLYSSCSESFLSPPRSTSPDMEYNNFHLLKSKKVRPLCLTVQHLLN